MCIQITPINSCIYTNKNEVNLNTKISTKTERISNVKCLQVRSYCHHSQTSYIQRMDLSLGQLLPAGWTTSLSCNGCFDTRLTKHMTTHCRNQLSPTSLYLWIRILSHLHLSQNKVVHVQSDIRDQISIQQYKNIIIERDFHIKVDIKRVIRKEKFKREENKYIFILLYRTSIYERSKTTESNIYTITRYAFNGITCLTFIL